MPRVTRPRAALSTSLCITAMACLAQAAPAPAHTIDVRGAAAAARTAAQTVGEVDQVGCWRPFKAIHVRSRHRALCVAWWVHTPAGESCTLFYEVRLARGLRATQLFAPSCQ